MLRLQRFVTTCNRELLTGRVKRAHAAAGPVPVPALSVRTSRRDV